MLHKQDFGYVIYKVEIIGFNERTVYYTAYEPEESSLWSNNKKRGFIFTDLVAATRVAASLEDAEIRCLYKTEELNQFRGEDSVY